MFSLCCVCSFFFDVFVLFDFLLLPCANKDITMMMKMMMMMMMMIVSFLAERR